MALPLLILNIATPLTVKDVAGELYRIARDMGLLDESACEVRPLPGAATVSGVWMEPRPARPRLEHPAVRGFGIWPTVTGFFEMDKFGDLELQTKEVLQVLSELLDRVPGNLVLHYDYETVWLLRLGADLSIDDGALWPLIDRVALLKQPYRRRPLKFRR